MKKKNRRISTRERRAKKIKEIFDPLQKDASYISNDKSLQNKHSRFITKSNYARYQCAYLDKYESALGHSIDRPKLFCGFKEKYPNIHERWDHMIRSCFDDSYPSYQYVGAKGIGISKAFLDSKTFCIWCLRHGLNSRIGDYKQYLQRKNKSRMYSPGNCYIVSETEIHKCKSLKLALSLLSFIKTYEEYHDKSVSYMTAYTRYFCYDLPAKGAVSLPCISKRHGGSEIWCFKPVQFYKSVATEDSCSMSTFLSRFHYSYLNGKFSARPYDMLKMDYSVREAANQEGKLSYKQWWDRKRKESEAPLINSLNNLTYSDTTSKEVYTEVGDSDVYS